MPKAREPVVDRSGLAISVGTCVLVKPDAGSLLYVAEVQKILKQGRLSVNWFYRPEEVLGGRKSFHGRQELFRSNHQDEVHVDTVECRQADPLILVLKCRVSGFGASGGYG